jgi:hypothetical protein
MRVKMERQRTADRLERGHQRHRPLGSEKPARVLDEHGIDAELYELAGLARVIVVGMDGAERVDDAAGGIKPGPFRRAHRHLHIAHVVERVIGRVIADAVGENPLRRQLDDVVGKEFEREQALPARHHDERRVLDPAADDAHALPRILAQIADADVEHGAADEIDGFEAGTVQPRRDVGHHRRGHARRPQALMRIAQRHVDKLYGFALVHRCGAPWRRKFILQKFILQDMQLCFLMRAWARTLTRSPRF